MLDRCCSFNGNIVTSCRCAKLLIPVYIFVQEEDSELDQMNYVMRKVNLIINLQNEQISIRNTREIHEMGKIVKISISFNRLVFPFNFNR